MDPAREHIIRDIWARNGRDKLLPLVRKYRVVRVPSPAANAVLDFEAVLGFRWGCPVLRVLCEGIEVDYDLLVPVQIS